MIIPIYCQICTTPHIDHYECDKCHAWLGGIIVPFTSNHDLTLKNPGRTISHCPYCGTSLTETHVPKYHIARQIENDKVDKMPAHKVALMLLMLRFTHDMLAGLVKGTPSTSEHGEQVYTLQFTIRKDAHDSMLVLDVT